MLHSLLGKNSDHIDPTFLLHHQVIEPFLELQARAFDAGIDLQILSGFRDYQKQKNIWEQKIAGTRPITDEQSRILDLQTMSKEEIVLAILKFSALPGFSRHHWGTDLDLYDAAAVDEQYQIKLEAHEYETGPFKKLHRWLNQSLKNSPFFRPYEKTKAKKGVAFEPWHLSHYPVAKTFEKFLTLKIFIEQLENSDLSLKEVLLNKPDYFYHHYIKQYFLS
jgi:LAS superfamily LD-carboxypeptidase LdcB